MPILRREVLEFYRTGAVAGLGSINGPSSWGKNFLWCGKHCSWGPIPPDDAQYDKATARENIQCGWHKYRRCRSGKFSFQLVAVFRTFHFGQSSMFWQRSKSAEADAYVTRIHQIMLFATSLAGKSKSEVVKALRDIGGIDIGEIRDTEDRLWSDRTMKDVSVSFSLDFHRPNLVSQVQISGHEGIDTLLVCVNCLETGEPKQVNFCVDVLEKTRRTPKLAKVVADKLRHHPDFDLEDFGSAQILLQKGRKNQG
jgi:hypothetical protein